MLKELLAYTQKHLDDAEPGFTTRAVRWSVEIAPDGRFLNLVPLGDGKHGQRLTRCPDMHQMNAGGKSHFFVESAQSAALHFKKDEDEKKKAAALLRHRYFRDLLSRAAADVQSLAPLIGFLEDESRMDRLRTALADHKAKPTDWITWRIGGQEPRQDTRVQQWWRDWRARDLTPSEETSTRCTPRAHQGMICFLSGSEGTPLASKLGDRAPRTLDLEGQGLFALGYYQQLAALRSGRKNSDQDPATAAREPTETNQTDDPANA